MLGLAWLERRAAAGVDPRRSLQGLGPCQRCVIVAILLGGVVLASTVLAGCNGQQGDGEGPAVSAAPSFRAWTVGDAGVILAADGIGTTWSRQESGTPHDLKCVSFADPLHGWAVGDSATILHTEDGGEVWRQQTAPTSADIWAVDAPDSKHAWVLANASDGDALVMTIFATSDGGTTWSLQVSKECDDLATGLAFADASHGWAVVGSGEILSTIDGGRRWRTTEASSVVSEHAVLSAIACGDANHVWAVGMRGIASPQSLVLASTDGGRTWEEQRVAAPEGLTSVFFRDALHGWLVTADGTLRSTADGGRRWVVRAAPGRGEPLHQVAFADAATGWALADGGIWSTVDGGATWAEEDSGGAHNLVGITCIDSDQL